MADPTAAAEPILTMMVNISDRLGGFATAAGFGSSGTSEASLRVPAFGKGCSAGPWLFGAMLSAV